MDNKEKILKAEELLKVNKQENVLNFFKKLSEDKQIKLAEEIINLNFEQLNKLYAETKTEPEISEKKITHIKYVDEYKLSDEAQEKYTKLGEDVIKNNQYAVVTMAGGQGTRLGHKGPKGTFLIDVLPEPKYLFQILAENLERANKKYGITLPWYIMTSTENNAETVKFFEEHNYFGYPKENVKFFMQGEIPMVDKKGKILLTEEGLIKQAANGHGGVFESMFKNNIVDDMKARGVEWVFVGPVDNPLVQMTDEVMIGYAKAKNAPAIGKSIVKANPEEKVGVFCKRNGKPSVVEYTEITKEMAEERDQTGELVFGESHINCNLFNIKSIEKIGDEKLPYHTAFKKATYMDENGEIIKPEEPNCYKFETFIFDSFLKLDNMEILRGKREEEFAPVKNKEGVDSPETALKLYKAYYNLK